ncbi:MAG: VanW family protein, partial [bacterium]|nr:VanW family protein [bacterium]
MHPSKNKTMNTKRGSRHFLVRIAAALGMPLGIFLLAYVAFEKKYEGKIYPNVWVGEISVGGQAPDVVQKYWHAQNEPFLEADFELRFEDHVATVSGRELDAGYDATLSATQAYLVGRSGHLLSDLARKFLETRVLLTPYFRYKREVFDEALVDLAERIDLPVQEALFTFEHGKVTAFKPSGDGRRVNQQKTYEELDSLLIHIPQSSEKQIHVPIIVDTLKPSVTTEEANTFGIRERIGRGYSEFTGSIPGRIHNVRLAASKVHGILLKPEETFSFNDAVGDISAATGFQTAYIIKDGRTVLGDGGGVCQVSSTLFRSALAAGLPILERKAHAYRVHYYED